MDLSLLRQCTSSQGGGPYLKVSAIDDGQGDNTTRKKEPSPRPGVQEGFMAASVCRHESTEVEGNPRCHRKQK
jgi:hypothetical protein